MPTGAVKSKGIQLQRSVGGSPDVFQTVSEVHSMDGPNLSLPTDDATSFDSTWAEVIAGIPDGGEVSFGMNWIPSNDHQRGLKEDLKNGTLRAFRLIYPDSASSREEFSAYVTAFGRASGGPNSKITASCTLRISGGVS